MKILVKLRVEPSTKVIKVDLEDYDVTEKEWNNWTDEEKAEFLEYEVVDRLDPIYPTATLF